MAERPTGAVTFLFTDVEGSTQAWEQTPTEMDRALEVHDRVLRGAIESHGGYVFATGGDSFSAAFYQAVVDGEVLPAIFDRHIPGLVGAHLMKADRVENEEVEFTTIMWFESLDSVKNFMGEDYRRAHMPENARAVLKRFDPEAKHFHLFGDFA